MELSERAQGPQKPPKASQARVFPECQAAGGKSLAVY